MARRTAETKCAAGATDEVIQALEPILAGSGNPGSLDSRLALLAQLRKNAAENEAAIDRQMLTRLTRMDEALSRALVRMPEAIVWEEATAKPVDVPEPVVEEDSSGLTAH